MTLKELTERITHKQSQIEKAVSLRNYERARYLELDLYKDVLEFMASRKGQNAELAKAALQSQSIRFTR